MPIETEHYVPLGHSRYHFHPWNERPLTKHQLAVVYLVLTALVALPLAAACAYALIERVWPALPLIAGAAGVLFAGASEAARDHRAR